MHVIMSRAAETFCRSISKSGVAELSYEAIPCGCSTCLNILNQIYTNNIQFLVPSEIFITAENITKSIETAKSQIFPFLWLNMLIFTVITFRG